MRPLILVHGFLGGSDQWVAQEPLAATRRLISVDLPGFGRNAGMQPLNRIADFAKWVLGEVSAQGIDRFDLLGHSMGGMIVQEMIRQAPERIDKLILYGTGAKGELPGRFETIETSMQRARDDGAAATARRIAATWFLEREQSPYYSACAEIAARAGLPAILAGLEAMQHWSGEGNLQHIAARTLVVWGDKDRSYQWSQIEQLWQTIPGCSLSVVPDCAHAVHAEFPDALNRIVDRFLSES